jgi:hypothetical protein
MATVEGRFNRTYIAGTDLSAAQFHFVALAADGEVDLAGDGVVVAGVLLNKPLVSNAATVAFFGRVIVEAGATVTAGDAVTSNAAGEVITAATGDIIAGYARESGVDGQIIAIDLINGGNAAA